MSCEHLALELPILALHAPAINLISAISAVVEAVASPTGVKTLSIRASVTNRESRLRSKAADDSLEQVLIVAVVFPWTVVFIRYIGAVGEAVTKPVPV